MKKINCLQVLFVLVAALYAAKSYTQVTPPAQYPSSAPVNFIRVWEPVKPYTSEADVISTSRSLKEVRQTTQYFDGLGRPLQTVIKKGSLETSTGANVDIISAIHYDEFGREQYKYLPFASTATDGTQNNGNFKTNPFQQQVSFYNTQLYGQTGETNVGANNLNWAYGKTNFEASPLNRVTESYAPGASWVGSENTSTPHLVKMKYWINTTIDEVRIWNVNNGAVGSFGTYTSSAAYPAGELYKNATEDEHGRQVIEFKDKEGKVILKKVQIGTTAGIKDDGTGRGHTADWLCTYYIYDDLNNLRCVIQPEGVKALSQNGWVIDYSPSGLGAEQCFRYEYDGRNRMIMKKVPGAGAVYMVYDARDRLVMTQDANMRNNNKWMVTLYDALNRPAETGIVNNSWFGANKTFAQHQADAAGSIQYPFPIGSYPIDPNWEQLSKTGYDNYATLPSVGLSASYLTTWNGHFATTDNNNWPYPQMPAQSTAVRGMPTWTQVKILNSNPAKYIYTVSIYDDKGRVIQVQSKNELTGGIDVVTTEYTWAGQPYITVQRHQITGTNAQATVLVTKMNYDDLGRLSSIEKKQSNTLVAGNIMSSTKITAVNEYDKLGQLKNKKLATYYSGGSIETLNYDYNIRGWMLGVNRDYIKDVSSRKFGFELSYDKTNNIINGQSYTNAYFNGNIAGMTWKSIGDSEKRKYDFTYDAANRLSTANFTQYTSGTFNTTAGLDFSVGGNTATGGKMEYDANGNIKEMWQKGWKVPGSDWIDKMTYTYFNYSNKLKAVTDAITADQKLGDFTDKNTTVTDYGYDKNGNLVTDLNKQMGTTTGFDLTTGGAITYNHLNLPSLITVTNKGTITYIYDAAGNKLQKITNEPASAANGNTATVTTTTYVAGFVYESKTVNSTAVYTNKLQFTGHEEGRIRSLYNITGQPHTLNGFAYDYMIKDHLGNVRMVLTDELQPNSYPVATMEPGTIANESIFYGNLNNTQINKPSWFTDPLHSTNTKVGVLKNASGSQKIGPNMVLKVMSGDKFTIRVASGWYSGSATNSNTNVAVDLLSILTNTVAGVSGGKATAAQLQNPSSGLPGGLTTFFSNQTTTGSKPKAYINWVLLDEQFKVAKDANGNIIGSGYSGFQQVQASGSAHIHNIPDLTVAKSGYLYIYTSNEATNIDVFFDNLHVVHTPGSLTEETHYYPFGLTMQGISSKAAGTLENKYQFSGKERQAKEFSDGSGLDYYDFGARNYDPQIGRWFNQDKFAEVYVALTPYQYAANNPIKMIDQAGHLLKDKDGNIIATSNGMAPSITRTQTMADGSKQSIKIDMESVTIYTDKGTPVQALRAVKAYVAEIKTDANGNETVGTYKEEKMYKNFRSNCHGYALADGNLWIGTEDNQASLKTILADEYTKDENGSLVVVEWTESDGEFVMPHTGVLNPDGTYNQKDDISPSNPNASRSDFTVGGSRTNTHGGQRTVNEQGYKKNSSGNKTTNQSSFKNQAVKGVRITNPEEIKKILKELGWQEK
jgi:RHS repeat-associated protein